ncbi:MAG: histidine phosphatase family protein [Actinomycetota bacterium]|nr:histidine phosphatase family protein [Actinomycetota bacterium]
MKERRILLVRHPETEANVDGRFVGRGDAPYTARGERQAMLSVDEIVGFQPDEIWSSPLHRAHHVAENASAKLGVPHVVDERLNELDFGQAEGLTYQQTQDRGIEFQFGAQDAPVAPGGESRADILVRSGAAVDAASSAAMRVAIVTHGGVFRSAVVHLLGLPIDAIWSFDIRNAQCALFRIVDGHTMLERFWQAD